MKCKRFSVVAGFTMCVALLSHVALAGEKLDDATILAIFDQANTVDIYTGRLGAKYGKSEEVRAMGRMVAMDHIAVQQMARDLANKLAIVPTLPDADTSVADQANAVAFLRSKAGPEFDRAYLKHEVAYHQSVVDAVKGTLLPSIKNDEFRALVQKVLPGFEHHLAETKALAKKFGVN